jgi:guanylate kinase
MIPIISIEEYRKRKPDVLLVMTWHFFDEIKKQEKDYEGVFIIPMPKVRLVA